MEIDPQLEAELREVMDGSAVATIASSAQRHAWLLLMCEAHTSPALKAHLMAPVLRQGVTYAAATLTYILLQARGLVHDLSSTVHPRFGDTLRDAHPDEPDGFKAAHIYVGAMLNSANNEEGRKLSHELAETLELMEPPARAAMAMHFVTLCGDLVRLSYEIREEQAAIAAASVGDEGDSGS